MRAPLPLFDVVHLCEGCDRTFAGMLPAGWSQCGASMRFPPLLAAWCPLCATDGTMERRLRKDPQ